GWLCDRPFERSARNTPGRTRGRTGRCRHMERRIPGRAAAGRTGLCATRMDAARRAVLGGLAHAPEPGTSADGTFGPVAARRAHQPPRSRRHVVARALA